VRKRERRKDARTILIARGKAEARDCTRVFAIRVPYVKGNEIGKPTKWMSLCIPFERDPSEFAPASYTRRIKITVR